LPNGRPLFQDYQTTVDLPKEKTAYDVDVPISQKTPLESHR
jgi:hypothetical protein